MFGIFNRTKVNTVFPVAAADSAWNPILPGAEILREVIGDERIHRYRAAGGIAKDDFQSCYYPALEKFAGIVQCLPASQDHHHNERYGLLRHTFEVCEFAQKLERCQALPPNIPAHLANSKKPLWSYGIFLLTLMHDVAKPLSDIRVVLKFSNGQNRPWTPLSGGLDESGAAAFKFSYLSVQERNYERHARQARYLWNVLVPKTGQHWLDADPELMDSMMCALEGDSNIILSIVKDADKESVSGHTNGNGRVAPHVMPSSRAGAAEPKPAHMPVRIEQRIFRAIKENVRKAAPSDFNCPGARIFVKNGLVAIVTPKILEDINPVLSAEGGAKIPRNIVIYNLLVENNIIVPSPIPGYAVWRIRIATAENTYIDNLSFIVFRQGDLDVQCGDYECDMSTFCDKDKNNKDDVVEFGAPAAESPPPAVSAVMAKPSPAAAEEAATTTNDADAIEIDGGMPSLGTPPEDSAAPEIDEIPQATTHSPKDFADVGWDAAQPPPSSLAVKSSSPTVPAVMAAKSSPAAVIAKPPPAAESSSSTVSSVMAQPPSAESEVVVKSPPSASAATTSKPAATARKKKEEILHTFICATDPLAINFFNTLKQNNIVVHDFLVWLRDAVINQEIKVNTNGALVHLVSITDSKGSFACVTPKIFKYYRPENEHEKEWTRVQRNFVQMKTEKQKPFYITRPPAMTGNGKNIVWKWDFSVLKHSGTPTKALSCIVLSREISAYLWDISYWPKVNDRMIRVGKV